MRGLRFALSLGTMLCVGGYALADTQIIAAQGDWTAGEHTPDAVSAPDVCVAMSDTQIVVVLRVDNQGDTEVRLSDDSWSLPANASGTIDFTVNGHNYSYPATAMSSTMVDATITQDQLTTLVGDMETASSMQVKAGSAAPTTIPLDGSQVVLTAFMTCAGIPNPSANTGGSNPFSSSN